MDCSFSVLRSSFSACLRRQVHRSPWKGWLLGLAVVLVVGWGIVSRVRADSCVTGPGVYCVAGSCGVWYDPPNNCSTTNTHCDYYAPTDLHSKTIPGCSDPNARCNPPGCEDTANCKWQVDPYNPDGGYCFISGGGSACQYCYDQSSLCTCTDAYGTAVSCCYYCPDGSGCGTGGTGGSPTPTPSAPPGCTVGAPTKPTLSSPTNGEVVATGNNPATVTLTWQAPSGWNSCNGMNKYNVYVELDDTPGDGLVTDSSTLVSNCSGITTTNCSVSLAAGHKYDWTVMAMNESYGNTADPSWFDLEGAVSGTVYLDENNSCSTSQPSNFGGGMTASLRNTSYSDSVGSNGQFSIGAPGGSYTLDMTIPNGYICSTGPLGTGCGGGCPTQTGVTSPSTGNNFFFTQQRSAWWQVVGGDVYAGSTGGGTVIRSLIPGSVPASQRHLILSPDGVVIYRTGSLALDSGDVSAGGYKARAAYLGKRYDFDFWRAHIGSVDSMSKPGRGEACLALFFGGMAAPRRRTLKGRSASAPPFFCAATRCRFPASLATRLKPALWDGLPRRPVNSLRLLPVFSIGILVIYPSARNCLRSFSAWV